MERPKHRRFILLGFALLAAAVLFFGRQWTLTTSEQPPAPPTAAAPRPAGTQTADLQASTAVEKTSASTPATPSTVSSAASGGLRGKVIDAVTRQPVKQFEVRMIRYWRDDETFRVDEPITKTFQVETGQFAWTDLAASSWRGAVQAPGYQLFDLKELKIVAGQKTRELVIPLLRGYAVRGRVFERSTGAGVGGAWIGFRQLNSLSFDKQYSNTKSKDDGTFVLDGVAGGDITLIVLAEEHAEREVGLVVDDKTAEQQIALSSGGSIAGTITTAAGTPVKTQVLLMGPGSGRNDETDDAGQFYFKHLPAGEYAIVASSSGGGARHKVVLGEDEHQQGILLAFAEGRNVRGVIRGLRPEHLQRTFVGLQTRGQAEQGSAHFQARPDQRGAYVFNSVPPGPARLSVYSESRQLYKAIDVPADQDLAFDLVFPPGVRLSGRVTQGGEPAQKTIRVQPPHFDRGPRYQVAASQDGQYEIEGVVPGEYRLSADEDFHRQISIASDTVLNIDIALVELGGSVVEDGTLVPIVGANVCVRGVEPATSGVTPDRTTDDFGNFKLLGLEPGEVVLTVYRPGYELYREKIAYSTPITNKKITLRKGGGVEVRAQRAAGQEQARGFSIVERVPNSVRGVHLWIPLDREGIGYVPSALAGSTFEYYGHGNKWVVVKDWDGQSLEVKL